MKAPGKSLLQVCGILFIVLAAFSIIMILGSITILLSWESQTSEVLQMFSKQGVTKSSLAISVVLTVIQSVIYLITGIMGVKNCNRPEKAQACLLFAIIVLVFVLGNAVYSVVLGQFVVYSIIFPLIIPLLYLWGAMRNKQAEA